MTRLLYLTSEAGTAIVSQGAPSRVTLEISTLELRRVLGKTADSRAERTLVALAELGRKAAEVATRSDLGDAGCQALRQALSCERALVFERDGARLIPLAAAIESGHTGGAQIAIPSDVVGAVCTDRK